MSSVRLFQSLFQRLMPPVARNDLLKLASTRCRCLSTDLKESAIKRESDDLVITDSCVDHLKKFAASGEFLRVSVEGGGCSGFSYKFDLGTEKEDDDLIFTKDGVKVVTDVDSFELLKGSKIDYETELIKSAFRVVDNPKSNKNCSCGVSFSIDL